jgi:cytochrome P450
MAIKEYIDKVGPGSRKDALGLLLAACDDNETRLSYKELVGAASIFLVAGIICQKLG